MNITGNNTYTGNTIVNDGKLVVNGNISTSQLTEVNDGAALGGAGTVGALTVYEGAMLAPGNSPGHLTVNGNLTIAGEHIWDLASLSTEGPGTNYDTLTVTIGNVLITGATLSLNMGDNAQSQVAFWQTDHVWEGIINNTGSGTLTGYFEPIDNSEWLSLGYFWTSQSGNDVDLRWTVVPEPSAAILAGLGAIGLLGRRSRSPRGPKARQVAGSSAK
jgi:autotransporter-associated beta strand protein